jgi:hypothetical protein
VYSILCSPVFCRGLGACPHPRLRSVFAAHAACGLRVASRPCSPKNLPHRSRENEYTDGRVGRVKDTMSLNEFTRVKRVQARWSGSGQRLVSFIAFSGIPPHSPHPFDGSPPSSKHPKTSAGGMSGRANAPLPSASLQEMPHPPAQTRSYGFIRVKETNYGVWPIRVTRYRSTRHSSD